MDVLGHVAIVALSETHRALPFHHAPGFHKVYAVNRANDS